MTSHWSFSVQFLTHIRLCFWPSSSRRCSTHGREADVVVGSVLRWSVWHGCCGCFSWSPLSLRLPLSSSSSLPRGKAGVGMPASRCTVLGRGCGTLGGAHGWKCSTSSSRCCGFAGESWTTFENTRNLKVITWWNLLTNGAIKCI